MMWRTILFLSCVGLSFSKRPVTINTFGTCVTDNLPLPTTFPPTGNGWRQVGSLDMLDYHNPECPTAWREIRNKKACGRINANACDSVIALTGNQSFHQVCGRFKGYQWGHTDAFAALFVSKPVTIDQPYVDGISITYAENSKRQHIFTFASGLMEQVNPGVYPMSTCPCTSGGTQPPPFVGSNYYCESGNPDKNYYGNQIFCDPLWDSHECRYDEATCCNHSQEAWFCVDLQKQVSSDLEIRICGDEGPDSEDIALESYQLYVR